MNAEERARSEAARAEVARAEVAPSEGRRRLLKTMAVGGGAAAVWSAPAITGITLRPAYAQASSSGAAGSFNAGTKLGISIQDLGEPDGVSQDPTTNVAAGAIDTGAGGRALVRRTLGVTTDRYELVALDGCLFNGGALYELFDVDCVSIGGAGFPANGGASQSIFPTAGTNPPHFVQFTGSLAMTCP